MSSDGPPTAAIRPQDFAGYIGPAMAASPPSASPRLAANWDSRPETDARCALKVSAGLYAQAPMSSRSARQRGPSYAPPDLLAAAIRLS